MGKRLAAKLKDIRATLRQRMHRSMADTIKWLQSTVRGYFQYHAIQATRCASKRFDTTYCDYGCASFGGAVSGAVGRGSVS